MHMCSMHECDVQLFHALSLVAMRRMCAIGGRWMLARGEAGLEYGHGVCMGGVVGVVVCGCVFPCFSSSGSCIDCIFSLYMR